ncbi:hypothetical protein SteCoe_33643 [Stentor coeruleus]|uniref:Palmitoyltransferase n=1 Tax=Stentor coeruleus TaxID=5963 RepID=A0A1R2AWF5_9CILI|nr:hypothetical protein SteCoe_33643 [Stentor coeruleus]
MTTNVVNTLSIAMSNGNKRYFKEILEEMVENHKDIQDDHGYNVFHMIAKGPINEAGLLEFLSLLNTMMGLKFSKDYAKNFINSKDKRENNLLPLHLAITKGKSKIAIEFIKLGADPLEKDAYGKNALHLAASFGTLSLLCFLVQDLSMDINSQDELGNTPLHLSILERREEMGLLILTLTSSINQQNASGDTPLHLSISTGNYRISKHLLYKKAQKHIKNLSNQTPSTICQLKDLKSLLRKRLTKKSFKYFLLIFIALIIQSGSLLSIELQNPPKIYRLTLSSSGVFILSLSFFIYLTCKNPGYENTSPMPLKELYEKYNPEFVCPYCSLKKHKGTRHCIVCNKCVRDLDHHCKWINNCVGKSNEKAFMAMLIWMMFQSSASTFFGCWLIYKSWFEDHLRSYEIIFSFISFSIFIIVVPVTVRTIRNAYKRKKLLKLISTKPQTKAINVDESSDTESMLLYQRSDSFNTFTNSRKNSAA